MSTEKPGLGGRGGGGTGWGTILGSMAIASFFAASFLAEGRFAAKAEAARATSAKATGYFRAFLIIINLPFVNVKQALNHIVKRGDSLWIIARRYGTTTEKIQKANNLHTTKLHIGQTLKIPENNKDRQPGVACKTYNVKSGDSPFIIAKRHNMRLERFLSLNCLTPRSKIYPGQTLYVK